MNTLESKSKGLSGYQLKIIGIVLMVFDHLHQMFYMFGAPMWLTMLGRPVAPIFLFLASEGFHYTKDKKKYFLRLWIAYALMSIASMLLQKALPSDVMLMNSIFGTLCLTAFYMWMVDIFKSGITEKKSTKIILSIAGALLPVFLNTAAFFLTAVIPGIISKIVMIVPIPFFVEGSYIWIALGVAFYLLKGKSKWIQIIPLVVLSACTFIMGTGEAYNIQWLMIFSAIPILLYNGKQGRKSKYFFYIFYPAHIYLFYIISYFLQTR